MKRLALLTLLLFVALRTDAQTTVTGTIVDPNGNIYANGTASATQVVVSGQNPGTPTNTTTNSSGFFTMSLASPASYVFTICATPTQLGPTANPTPKQVCFTTPNPLAISGASQDISTQLNAVAATLGPSIASISSVLARKPAASDGIQYVSVNGNDSQDCRSWGSACATRAQAYTNLPTASDGSKYGTIYVGPGVFLTTTLALGTSGHNDAVNIIGTCGGGNIVSGSPVSASTVFQHTGGGFDITQTVTSSGNQNDKVGKFSCFVVDGTGDATTNAGGIQVGGTENIIIEPTVKVSNFTASGDVGIQVLNNTGINTNDYNIQAYLFNNTTDFDAKGPDCSAGTPNSSNAQHHFLNFVLSIFSGQTAVHAECGVDLSRGTMILTGAMSGGGGNLISTDTHSAMVWENVFDNVENNTGSNQTAFLAGAGQTLDLYGSFFAVLPGTSSTIGFTTSGTVQLHGWEQLGANPVFDLSTSPLRLGSSGGGSVTYSAPSTASAVAVTGPVATTPTPVAGSCTMTTTTCTITVVSGASKCIATDQGGTIAGQCAISGTTLTVTAASSNTSVWAVLWW